MWTDEVDVPFFMSLVNKSTEASMSSSRKHSLTERVHRRRAHVPEGVSTRAYLTADMAAKKGGAQGRTSLYITDAKNRNLADHPDTIVRYLIVREGRCEVLDVR